MTKLLRLVVSDLHLATGTRRGEFNPLEGFYYDDEFEELLQHYDEKAHAEQEIELILNGDIFDLLKVKLDNVWPIEITPDVAAEKLRHCLDGHPTFVRALQQFLSKAGRRIVYLPGNHDLDMWFTAAQDIFRRYIAPGALADRVRFITATDTYHLPEGIQIRHGHQFEAIHRVNYQNLVTSRKDGVETLNLPWGSLWILEVLNPAKELRTYVDHIQPFNRFIWLSLLLDTRFALQFIWSSCWHWLKRRVFTAKVWRERLLGLPALLRSEILSLGAGGYENVAVRTLKRLRGVHTLIVGHSHLPRYRSLPQGKLLVNTGTWIRMINLDLEHLGQRSGLTYATIEYDQYGKPITTLMRWRRSAKISAFVHYPDF
jgi:UDP-2,3-diacylglucosamine pyrophosphatase LpxH